MTIATVQFTSRALQRTVTYNIFIPEGGPGPYPVLLQLHGHGDNHTTWLQNTKLALYALSHKMIIVMPEGGTSYYLNLDEPLSFRQWNSQKFEDFLMQDLWQHIQDTYHIRPGRWAIGGNSMGGYGAMRLACKYPDHFSSVWAHSGAYYTAEEFEDVVPDHMDADVFRLAQKLKSSPHQVQITFDCGIDDYLLERSRRLHLHMENIDLPHQYFEHPGSHWWGYWDEHLPAALAQHASVFEREEKIPESAQKTQTK